MVLDALAFISFYFQMPLPMLLDSIRYADDLNVWDSLLYLAVFLTLLFALLLTYVVVQSVRRQRSKLRPVPFIVVLVAFVAVDWWVNLTPQKSMAVMRNFSESYVPVDDAASLHAGLARRLEAPRPPSVLIVMVEGLGAFVSKEHRETVWQPLLGDRLSQVYSVKSGTTDYFGSTTSGEARELCNLNADYRDFRDRNSADCLPRQAREAGYRTAAFHAFNAEFFERNQWFPKIGFEEMYFLENRAGLKADRPLRHCGITFRGLCDADVATSVKDYLTGDTDQPKFVYWLTLNSHKPVQPGEVPERLGCEDGGPFGDRELCLMSEQWLNVSYLVRDIALSDGLGETEILLVGDHHPPLFTRSGRRQFLPGKVAWLHLKPKAKMDDGTRTAAVRPSERAQEN